MESLFQLGMNTFVGRCGDVAEPVREQIEQSLKLYLNGDINYDIACLVAENLVHDSAHIHEVEKVRGMQVFDKSISLSSSDWSLLDHENLLVALKIFGTENWTKISKYVGKDIHSCYLRWKRTQNPTKDSKPWTSNEVKILTDSVASLGVHNWRQVAMRIPGKTDVQCRMQYYALKANQESSGESSELSAIASPVKIVEIDNSDQQSEADEYEVSQEEVDQIGDPVRVATDV